VPQVKGGPTDAATLAKLKNLQAPLDNLPALAALKSDSDLVTAVQGTGPALPDALVTQLRALWKAAVNLVHLFAAWPYRKVQPADWK
jgi:hypothetical protein